MRSSITAGGRAGRVGVAVALGLACGPPTGSSPAPVPPDPAPAPVAPAPVPAAPEPTPSVRFSMFVPEESTGDCEWRAYTSQGGPSKRIATLPGECESDASFERIGPGGPSLVFERDQVWRIERGRTTGVLLPDPPDGVQIHDIHLTADGAVACEQEDASPTQGPNGYGFYFEGAYIPVAETHPELVVLDRAWRTEGGDWKVVATEALSFQVMPVTLDCAAMPSVVRLREGYSSAWPFTAETLPEPDLAEVRQLANAPDADFVAPHADHPIAVRHGPEDDSPENLPGPLYAKIDGRWRILVEPNPPFVWAWGGDGFAFAEVDDEWRLYSTVDGSLLWKSAGFDGPMPWAD